MADVGELHEAPVLSVVREPQPATGAETPRATYRVQLNKSFTFNDATAIIPYLATLGISHVYCSPYFKARSGSLHGYGRHGYRYAGSQLRARFCWA